MRVLSPRERKLVAIAILIAIVAGVYAGMVRPFLTGFGVRAERRAELRAQYAHGERTIASLPRIRRAAEAQARGLGEMAIAAPGPDQAAERLRERLAATISAEHGELRSSEAVESPKGWVRAAAEAKLSNDQLVRTLARLRSERPYLVADAITITADRALTSNRLDLLDVRIEASIPYLLAK